MKLKLKTPDVWLCVNFIGLCAIGWVTVYSASDGNLSQMLKHSVHLLLAAGCIFMLAQVDIDDVFIFSLPFYAVVCAALAVLLVIDSGGDVRRWLRIGGFGLQPSEFMKLALPMAVAWCLGRRRGKVHWLDIAFALVLLVIPVALVVKQPDLGTAVVIAMAGCAALWIGGLSRKMLVVLATPLLVASPFLWSLLHEYQQKRIIYFLFPQSDPLGAGYHVIQSTIAIGSGGMNGKGWQEGTQSHLDFLPERTTDFAFSVYCEEFGFIGFLFMLAMFTLLLYRGLAIAINSPTVYGRILAASLCFVLAVCGFINMGMTSGILPVVGLPMPFISMGGSALLTTAMSVGMLCCVQASIKGKKS